ncbi:MAG: Ig-like domain-containing protein, partial [Thermodesulfobacteriota bacterium]
VSSPIGNTAGTWVSSGATATFTPESPFAPLTEYTVTVAASVRAADGEALAATYVLQFTTVTAFHTFNFVTNQYQLKPAQKVGEGTNCRIYVEQGKTVSPAAVAAVIDRFDNDIYGNVVARFGSEPSPGADGTPMIFIFLMDIVDGYVPGGGYIAGYFDAVNELPIEDVYASGYRSNQKEIFYMDISPGDPSGTAFYRTLAHEFQHMIHWEHKENDDAWLNEAMSEAAPFYAGFGANYTRVQYFQTGSSRSDSLTQWNDQLADYSVVYMWAQYMADRFPVDVFQGILARPENGIESVDQYLQANHGITFAEVFRNWSIAVLSGTTLTWPGHPEWSYTTIDTWPGMHGGIFLPGFFTSSYENVVSPTALPPWSIGLYKYTSPDVNQTFTWNPSGVPAPQASFYDNAADTLTFDLAPLATETYNGPAGAYLVLQNPSGFASSSSTTTNPAILAQSSIALSPLEKVRAASRATALGSSSGIAGEPVPVCVHEFVNRRAKDARERVKEVREARWVRDRRNAR